jgi:hypothetical protein
MNTRHFAVAAAAILILGAGIPAALAEDAPESSLEAQIDRRFEALDHRLDTLEKAVDDIQWYNKVGDVAEIDKIFITGPPPAHVENPKG